MFAKAIIQKLLSYSGLRLRQLPPDGLSATNLFEDLKKLIPSDSPICLDVGANIGQTAKKLNKTFKAPYIHAFEPSSEIFKTLKSNVKGERMFLYNYALGNEIGKREFINYERACLSSFLTIEIHQENRFSDVEEKKRELVELNTADSFLNENKIKKVDLLKIDTQGFDMNVLMGAEKSLENGVINYVLIELNFVKMYQNQNSPQDTIQYLKDRGLHLIDYYEKVRQNNTLAWCTALFGRR